MTKETNSLQHRGAPPGKRHGDGGVYYAGDWLDIEDCAGTFTNNCEACEYDTPCPRSQSRNATTSSSDIMALYDVVIIGAGCIGGAVARELSRYALRILWLEAADDVSQGATKGNSGIVHSGYDDESGTNRAKFCWPGNQMFAQLDKDLHFGYQMNGSLVVAFTVNDLEHLEELKKRGETNGVQHLKIIGQEELRQLEPHISKDAIGALYSPTAGNVIPYEYAIALAENAVDNGVQLRIRREVKNIEPETDGTWKITVRHWEPEEYVQSTTQQSATIPFSMAILALSALVILGGVWYRNPDQLVYWSSAAVAIVIGSAILQRQHHEPNYSDFVKLVQAAGSAEGTGGAPVNVDDMLVGGSGCSRIQHGVTVDTEVVHAKFIVNCAGGASDVIANMIGDHSFKIKPRIGDYILLRKKQGHLAKHTIFPCPDPVLGKGVLVQTTLWNNLILGPTARDMHKAEASSMSPEEIHTYILSKSKQLVPGFDAHMTIHTFCGARAKSDRGDWIIEPSRVNPRMIHVAGIDSPGLAGSPAIAVEVVALLKSGGLTMPPNTKFNPKRAPIIIPKNGLKGLKIGPVGKNDSDGKDETKMAANVVCKCERVTELEVVRALRRSLPIDSTQGIRKRTRAGMGSCQAKVDNYNCEARVRAIIARELHVPVQQVGGRPWPATSILKSRWPDDSELDQIARCAEN